MNHKERRFPVLDADRYPGCPARVPWGFVAPHERQAKYNHDQTLTRLAERGGLSPAKLLCVVTGKHWSEMPEQRPDEKAVPELLRLLTSADPTRTHDCP